MDLKLGIVSDEISRNFRKAVEIGKKCGIWRYEIRYLQSGRITVCDESELREVEAMVDGEGIEITGISPGLFKYAQTEVDFEREMSEIFPRAVELAGRWGLSNLIIFGFQKPTATEEIGDLISSENPPSFVIDGLNEAAVAAGKSKIKLLIESEPVCWADTAQATVNLINKADTPFLGINYDPSNIAWMERRDPINNFDLLAPFIGNVHLKNHQPASRGSGKPVWIVPDKGVLSLKNHLAALQQIGYQGAISLEPHIENISPEIIGQCKRAVENLWNEALGKRSEIAAI